MPSASFVVAVIDDDDMVRDGLRALLPAFDCKVELYPSADAFLVAITTTRAHCLMIDIQLGLVSGIALGRGLTQAGYRFPVIYMSGSADEETRQEARDAGCVAFLCKPFTPEGLSRALDAARRRNAG